MTTKLRFEDHFWGGDFCSTAGFEVIDKRLKDGSNVIKNFIDHLKQRAKLEEDYSKNLTKLAKGSDGGSEIGTLRAAWDCLKSETMQIAQEHKTLSNSFLQQASNLGAYIEERKATRKQQKELVDKSSRKKVDYYNKVLDQRKTYENKSRELHECGQKIAANSNVEKLLSKQEKLQTEVTKADETYKKLITSLEEARQNWEKEMAEFSKVAQKLEEDRLRYIQDQMWITTNFISQTCVDDDKHCENIRKSLEQCDFENDITLFIKEKMTGTSKPAPIPYVPDKHVYAKRALPTVPRH